MNTEPDNSIRKILPAKPSDPSEDAQARLEAENSDLKDRIREERFGWILFSIILFDMAMFANVQTTGVPIAIVLLEAALLVLLARRLGVEDIVRLVDRLVDGWTRRGGNAPANEVDRPPPAPPVPPTSP